MMNDPERRPDSNTNPTGNVVLLPGPLTPTVNPSFNLGHCYPPQPVCPNITATYVGVAIEDLGDRNFAKVAFSVESSLAQELSLRIQISEGEGKDYLWQQKFVTNEYKLQAAAGSTYVIGLDKAAQEAAEPYFEDGNTLSLVLQPPQRKNQFEVQVGMAAASEERSEERSEAKSKPKSKGRSKGRSKARSKARSKGRSKARSKTRSKKAGR